MEQTNEGLHLYPDDKLPYETHKLIAEACRGDRWGEWELTKHTLEIEQPAGD